MSVCPPSPLRVLGYFSFPGGGIGKYTHHLFTELAKDPAWRIEWLTQPDFAWRQEATYRLQAHLFQISHPNPLVRKARFLIGQLANPQRLAAYAKQTQPQIIHLADVNHLFLPLWEQALFNQAWRVVMTVHDVTRLAAIIERHWENRQLRRVYRYCDALFVHSRAQRDELLDYAQVKPERVHIVPHGPYPFARYSGSLTRNELRRKWSVPEKAVILLFFGFIKPYKGLDFLLQAVERLDRGHALHVLVAGSGGSRYQDHVVACQQHIASPALQDQVTAVFRHIDESEIPELLELSDAVALPYREVFTSQSGVLNIASHYQRPIVATPAHAFVEGQTSGSIGIIATDFTLDAYQAALQCFLESRSTDWAFDRYLAANSWERNAHLTKAVYRALIDGAD